MTDRFVSPMPDRPAKPREPILEIKQGQQMPTAYGVFEDRSISPVIFSRQRTVDGWFGLFAIKTTRYMAFAL